MMNKMGRVLVQQSAFPKRLKNQRDVSLLEIADAAVNELRAPTGCSLRKVGGLEQERLVAAGCGVDGNPQSGCASTDDDHIPMRGVGELLEELRAVHD
jgi:hypothetical protein